MPRRHLSTVARSQSRYHVPLFFLLLAVSLIGAYVVLRPLIPVVAVTLVFSIVIFPFFQALQKAIPRPGWMSALITTILALLGIVLPILLTLSIATAQLVARLSSISIAKLTPQLTVYVEEINAIIGQIPGLTLRISVGDVTNFASSVLEPALNTTINTALSIGSNTVMFFGQFMIFLLLIQYVLPQLPKLYDYVIQLSPFNSGVTNRYLSRCQAMIFDTLRSSVVIATVQASVGWGMFWLLGIPMATTLALLLWFAALLPVVGGALVTIPVSIALAISDNWLGALIVLLVQVLFFSNIDNVIRARLVSKEANLNPGLMLLAVVGGIQVYGLIGLLYGPLILIVAVVSLDMYRTEYR